jgi:hypothetical protein
MRFRRPSPATAISCLALFVALSGTSYAAITVTSKDVRNNSLTSADVRDRSLLGKDFKRGEVPAGARGATGPAGPAGAKGDPGATGDTGPVGPSEAFSSYTPGSGALSSTPAGVESLALPAGAYLMTVSVTITATGAGAGMTCSAGPGGQNLTFGSTLGANEVRTFSPQLTFTLAAPATVPVSCAVITGGASVSARSVAAIRVGTATTQ